jgi:ABC-2 type transport system ATP-binding protein
MRGHRAVVEEFWALRDVSFEVAEGSTFGLIGENGSGKSTMLKCLARILRPDEGRVTVQGKVSALLELGAGFHPELSGRENVFLNGAILGLRQKELQRRFDSIVDFAGISQFIDQPVKNYSSGMYVRLGFSVAINVDPDVLLVDEVLAVGDEAFQRKCNEKFAELRLAGKTIVLVSHGMSAVHNLCDRVAWLEHGRVKMLDDARKVVDEYTGNVQIDREVDVESGNTRWGSGEGRIERVDILNSQGESVTRVQSGDPITIRFHYAMSEPIERPVFGMAIHTLDGTHVTGPNTRDANCVPEKLDGTGYVDLVFDRLLLLPGTYDLTCSLVDYHILHPYDFRHRVLRFDVERGSIKELYGVVSLGGDWRIYDTESDA